MKFPRRACIEHMSEAEYLLYTAAIEVEKLGCSTTITNLVNIISDTRSIVADIVDEKFNYSDVEFDE